MVFDDWDHSTWFNLSGLKQLDRVEVLDNCMGMFDTLRSSYDLGPGFWDKELQTKDLGAFMSHYWIDPAGRLFRINYDGTHDWDINPAFGWDAGNPMVIMERFLQ